MDWIYLSPHLDDVVISCGGLIWEQVQSGQVVQVWTICAGDPPGGMLSPFAAALHKRWNTGKDAIQNRRSEDRIACAHLGVSIRHFDLPDCIYRMDGKTFLYDSETALFNDIHPGEMPLVPRLAAEVEIHLPAGVQLVSPLALGNHVDHQLVRRAAEKLLANPGITLWYYADYPYASHYDDLLKEIQSKWEQEKVTPVSSRGLEAWQNAVAAYRSQLSTFWQSEEQMRMAIEGYLREMGGIRLWCKKITGVSTILES